MLRLLSVFFSCFAPSRLVSLSGRASREEYWTFVGLQILLLSVATTGFVWFTLWQLFNEGLFEPDMVALAMLDPELGEMLDARAEIFLWCVLGYAVVSFIPNFTCTIRRYHDVGLSAIWFLFVLICNFAIVAIIFVAPLEILEQPTKLILPAVLSQIGSVAHVVICMLPGNEKSAF